METFYQYENGYYKYVVTITFRDDLDYCRLSPVKAQVLFKAHITKYLNKRNVLYFLCPEISNNGRFHYHGLFIFKCDATNYKEHEKDIRMIKNYCNRNYGINYWQQIQSFVSEYTVNDIRFYCRSKQLKTTFKNVYDYITKQEKDYPYLKQIKKY